MGEATRPTFTLREATVDDAQGIAEIFLRGLSWDPISKVFDDILPFEVGRDIQMQRQHGRLTAGHELGASRTWKVVDENEYASSSTTTSREKGRDVLLMGMQENGSMGRPRVPCIFDGRPEAGHQGKLHPPTKCQIS